jgi:hypothetical protein
VLLLSLGRFRGAGRAMGVRVASSVGAPITRVAPVDGIGNAAAAPMVGGEPA